MRQPRERAPRCKALRLTRAVAAEGSREGAANGDHGREPSPSNDASWLRTAALR